jgi:hypothetical protein
LLFNQDENGASAPPPQSPRKGLLKDGFRDADGYPMAVPYIVTRYVIPQNKIHADELERNPPIMPCRVAGIRHEGERILLDIVHCRPDVLEKKRAELQPLIDAGSYDAEFELNKWLPWTFEISKEDSRRADKYGAAGARTDLVTVIRLPEVELANPGMRPYGVNPTSIKIQLPYTEDDTQTRSRVRQMLGGAEPDFHCFDSWMKNYKAGKLFCKGNGREAARKVQGQKERMTVPCNPSRSLVNAQGDRVPNPAVCEYIGAWRSGPNGPVFEENKKQGCKNVRTFSFRIAGVGSLHIYQLVTGSDAAGNNISQVLAPLVDYFNGRVSGCQMILSVRMQKFNPIDARSGNEIKTKKPIWVLDNDPEFSAAVRQQLGGPAQMFIRQLATQSGGAQPLLPIIDLPIDDDEDQGLHIDEFYSPGEPEPAAQTRAGWVAEVEGDSRIKKMLARLIELDPRGWSSSRLNAGLGKYFDDAPTMGFADRLEKVLGDLAGAIRSREAAQQSTAQNKQQEQDREPEPTPESNDEEPPRDADEIVDPREVLSETEKKGLDSLDEQASFF